jgi:DNA polymerase III alpha subunit
MIQLKIRTEYSFGQTFAPIGRIIEYLKAIKCTAAGIVDNNTWGHVPWFKACKDADIQPLLGASCAICDDDVPLRMWFLAKNKKGLIELYNLLSQSHHQKLKTKRGPIPRLYRHDVLSLSPDIIKFAGEMTDDKFLKRIKAVIDLDPSSRILNQRKKTIAKEHKLQLVNVSDNSYVYEEDADIFDITAKAGLKMTPQHILDELPNQTYAKKIATMCKKLELPRAPDLSVEGDLEALCKKGIKHRKIKWVKRYKDRLRYELDLIKSKNYESYFIIVADMVQYAKKHMLVGPSRGSAAGSLVCYLSRITEIDPMEHDLYFERFIDVTRKDLPDIDLDFPDRKRHLVFEYMAKKYGVSNVAHIGTINKYKPRSALIQVCKALGIPPSATGAVKVAMIERSSADARASQCLEDTFNSTTPGQEFIKQYPQAKAAYLLEGHASHTGIHAAGLLVSVDEINNYAVVDDKGIAHIEKHAAEYLNLLKIDVLGLRTLTILEDSGIDVDWYGLKFNDKKAIDIFNDELLCGIFQFDGEAMRSISKLIKFKNLSDIDAVTALARPGPFRGGVTRKYIERKNGKKYKPIHPKVEEQMSETFGLPIYQEQTLAICRQIGLFDWEGITIIRKAMSKSYGQEFFQKYKARFIEGAASQNIPEDIADETWELINAMGAWQMNKAHTRSYAVISYWCAYLKAHYHLEFAASVLRNTLWEDRIILLLREMKNEGVDYVPFDVNKSELNWSAKDGKLYGGFTVLKGIGEITAKKFIEARNAKKLTPKQLEKINSATNPYSNIFPFHSNYENYYTSPQEHGIAGDVCDIKDINTAGDVPHNEGRVFLAELIHKNARNINEDVFVKKRNGKIEGPPLEFVDVRLRDDTGTIGGRVDRFRHERIGKELLENVPTGAHLLVRAKFFNNIPWAFISKWRRIDQ